ncbi:hypothetical protein [Kribbella sp. CA-294648]|uniref:hypothetical protein n=1 Tax=Kribbella sp. CA-294648 TaxID=3239948 RepID=UPI003D89C788
MQAKVVENASTALIVKQSRLFYADPRVAELCGEAQRALMLLASIADALLARARGIKTTAIVVEDGDLLLGGILIGWRGTMFRGAVKSDASTFDVISMLDQGFVRYKEVSDVDLSFWTYHPIVMRWSKKYGFVATGRRRYIKVVGHGWLRWSWISSSNVSRVGRSRYVLREFSIEPGDE